MLTRLQTFVVLGIVSGSIVAHEVLLTRLLSVTTWYSLAFVVLSLAMIGLTAGALQAARAADKPLGPWIAHQLTRMAAVLLIADALTVLTPMTIGLSLGSLGALAVVASINALALALGGSIVTRLMTASEIPLSQLYAVDLGAAALGALTPLVLLGPLSAPSAVAAIAAIVGLSAWLVAPRNTRWWGYMLPVVAVGLIVVSEASTWGLRIQYVKGKSIRVSGEPFYEAWNPLSYVYVPLFREDSRPALWAASPYAPKMTYSTSRVIIDGDAWTPLYAYRQPSEMGILRYDGITAAHVLRPSGTACIIGVGGGRDVLAALYYGHEHVLGIEINPSVVETLRRVSDRSPLLLDPRVTTVIGDGRAVLANSATRCSVLQASAIDTWAATGAGAFAHTEASLYTREAWSIFLRRVEPNGILTFSRWYDRNQVSETARLVSLSVAALLDRGVTNPLDHLALLVSTGCATVLVSPTPFSETDREALRQLDSRMGFQVLLAPYREPENPLLKRLVHADSADALAVAGLSDGLDTSAPTDDRPFFFQLVGSQAWLHPLDALHILRQSRGLGGGVLHGNIVAIIELMIVMIIVLVIGAVLLGPTFIAAARSRTPLLPGISASIYFSALGAGFMLAEIALVQRMHVMLGHPTYALVVVLAGLLVATGVGSALSPRLLRSRRSVVLAAVCAGALLCALPHLVIGPLAAHTLEAPLGLRMLLCGGCAGVVGLVLGMLFPAGLSFVSRTKGTPLALALNGATSLLGSAAAIVISVTLGISTTFVAAGLVYLVAAWAGPTRWRAAL